MTRRAHRGALGTGAVAAALVVGACGSGSPSALDPKGPASERIAQVWWLMLALAVAVYLVVGALILLSSRRKRAAEEGDRRLPLSENAFIWVGGVAVPTAILLVLAVVTVSSTAELTQADDDPLRIEVEGFKWWWEVRYPDADVVTANEIHVPAGRPVEIELTSADVIHSFWVPELAGKVDLVPGQRNVLRLTADEPGEYRGQCAEFCGIQHARMAFLVIADEPTAFEDWIERHRAPPPDPPAGPAAEGERIFESTSCAGCHTIRGTSARGTSGPDLSDFGSRRTLGAALVENNRGNLGGWIVNAQALKPGNLMPPVSLEPDELQALIAYLESRR
ncbi:MAG: cytochrome c oxidase subunit II [Actinobacteria bacterium]|nr:cytochrome c oxidase subunit II [Actinomycetota bacterium]